MPDPGDEMRRVALDPHTSATAIPLLPPPKLAIDKFLVNFHTRRNARDDGDQRLSMRLSGSTEAKHKRSILQEGHQSTCRDAACSLSTLNKKAGGFAGLLTVFRFISSGNRWLLLLWRLCRLCLHLRLTWL